MSSSLKSQMTLNEKDSLVDQLNLEKSMVKLYATALTEGASKGFREMAECHIGETAKDQQDVFLAMTDHGYYKVQSAEEQVLSQQKDKFQKVKTQLC